MYRLEREETMSTPYILIDETKSYMKWKGESFPENITKTYWDIVDWVEGYMEKEFSEFIFDCEMVYFNSSTSKVLFKLFEKMNQAGKAKRVIVNWICSRDNDIMIEYGEDFKENFENLDFKLSYNS